MRVCSGNICMDATHNEISGIHFYSYLMCLVMDFHSWAFLGFPRRRWRIKQNAFDMQRQKENMSVLVSKGSHNPATIMEMLQALFPQQQQ